MDWIKISILDVYKQFYINTEKTFMLMLEICFKKYMYVLLIFKDRNGDTL